MTKTPRRSRRGALLLAGTVAAVGVVAAAAAGSSDSPPPLPSDTSTSSGTSTSSDSWAPTAPTEYPGTSSGYGYDQSHDTEYDTGSPDAGSPDIDGIVEDSYQDMWNSYRGRIGGW